jgi:hypothetical protein
MCHHQLANDLQRVRTHKTLVHIQLNDSSSSNAIDSTLWCSISLRILELLAVVTHTPYLIRYHTLVRVAGAGAQWLNARAASHTAMDPTGPQRPPTRSRLLARGESSVNRMGVYHISGSRCISPSMSHPVMYFGARLRRSTHMWATIIKQTLSVGCHMQHGVAGDICKWISSLPLMPDTLMIPVLPYVCFKSGSGWRHDAMPECRWVPVWLPVSNCMQEPVQF